MDIFNFVIKYYTWNVCLDTWHQDHLFIIREQRKTKGNCFSLPFAYTNTVTRSYKIYILDKIESSVQVVYTLVRRKYVLVPKET